MAEKDPLGRGEYTIYWNITSKYSLYPHKDVLGNLTDAISLDLPAEFAKMKALYVLNAVDSLKITLQAYLTNILKN